MRSHLVPAALVLLASVSLVAAQSPDSKKAQQEKAPKPGKVVALTGCIVPDEGAPGQFMFEEVKSGARYRLTGTDVKEFAGQRVEIAGLTPKKLEIRGGLLPNPNVAAQAGALDASHSALSQGAGGPTGTGTGQLPEFRVRAVKQAAGGACPEK